MHSILVSFKKQNLQLKNSVCSYPHHSPSTETKGPCLLVERRMNHSPGRSVARVSDEARSSSS